MTYKAEKVYLLFLLFLALPFFSSCNKDDTVDLVGNWVTLSSLDGDGRTDAVGFSIGSKGYVGTGYNGEERLNDFWEYDPSTNSWTQKASIDPNGTKGKISNAAGFATDTKGYIGTGYNGKTKLNLFWEYDPVSNKWDSISPFPGTARYSAVGMSINNKGYVGTGYDGNYVKDFWEYDPQSKTWTSILSIGGNKRRNAASFVIDGKGYVVSGENNGSIEHDVWVYDPSTSLWTEKRDISGTANDAYDDDYANITGAYRVGFSINGKGYLATGSTTSSTTGGYVWEYDPVDDLWYERTSFEGYARTGAVGFAVGDFGYVTTGHSGSYYFDDIWSFDPVVQYNKDDK